MNIDLHGVAEGTQPGQRHDMDHLGYIFHGYSRVKGISAVIVTDGEYPSLVAHQLLSKIMDDFLTKYPRAAVDPSPTEKSYPLSSPIKEWIEKYDNPENADSITKIQQELDSTKIVLHKTVPFPAPRYCIPILTFTDRICSPARRESRSTDVKICRFERSLETVLSAIPKTKRLLYRDVVEEASSSRINNFGP